MSETVKLIVEIPKDAYDATRSDVFLHDIAFDIWMATRNGIPLDDVLDKISAEIDEKISRYEHFSLSNTINGLMTAKKIIEKHKAVSE